MGMITNVRQNIAQAFTVTTPYDGPLPDVPGRSSDHSFVIASICLHATTADDDETIDVLTNDVLGSSWSARDLADRYRRFKQSPALSEHFLSRLDELSAAASAFATALALRSELTNLDLGDGITVAEMAKSLRDSICMPFPVSCWSAPSCCHHVDAFASPRAKAAATACSSAASAP